MTTRTPRAPTSSLHEAMRAALVAQPIPITLVAVLVIVVAAIATRSVPATLAHVPLAVVGAAVVVTDATSHTIPRQLVYLGMGTGVPAMAILAVVDGWASFGRAIAGAAALGVVYLVMVLAHPSGLGAGDARFAVLLGLYAGWLGWASVVITGALPFLLALGPTAWALARRRRERRIALGPYILAAYLIALGASRAGL